MAIGTDDAILKFGTQDEVTAAGGTSFVDGNDGISAAADIDEWTNDDDATLFTAVLEVTYAATPDSGTADLYVTLSEVEGTNDEPQMDSAFDGIFLGSRTPDAVTSKQYLVFGPFSLPATKSAQPYQFWVKNAQGDGTHDMSAGWKLYLTPYTAGPHG